MSKQMDELRDGGSSFPNLLLVGGTGRNVGKTEFICRLINKMSATHPVYALKISAIFPDEGLYHGSHDKGEGQKLFVETRLDGGKDTSRMLRAGATRVYYLRSEDHLVAQGFLQAMQEIPNNSLLVCESNSLREYLHPGLAIVVTRPGSPVKPRAKKRLADADLVITSDGRSGFVELDWLHYQTETGWFLRQGSVPIVTE